MSNANVKLLKHFEAPKEYGVYYRLLCLTGDNKGVAYFLQGSRVILGRSDKADIVLKDLKSSREHAELAHVGEDYIVTDLGSQNGIIVNDLKIKQHKLKDGDKLIIGSTVFKFGKVIVKEDKKESKVEELKNKLEKVKRGDEEEKASAKPGEEGPKKIKPIHMIIGVAVLVVLMMDGGDDKGKKKEKQEKGSYKLNEISSEFETALQKRRYNQDRELKDKLNNIFQKGLREYREENYFRAMKEFNLALVLSPNDGQAQFYLQKTKDALDKKITNYKMKSKRDEDSLHYQSAIVSYCAIIRLLHNYPEDERYKEAELSIRELEKKLDMEENEVSCLQK